MIGQGNTKVTLLQLAAAYAALANGGYLYRPQLVQEVLYPDGRVRMSFAPELTRRIEMDPDNRQRIVDALRGVVEAPQGTAHDQWTPGLDVAGKTGTAEVHRSRSDCPHGHDTRTAEQRYRDRDHAWFAGFAPADDPQIVVVVLVEHGGYGGRFAAPIAFDIFREYFKRIAPPRQ